MARALPARPAGRALVPMQRFQPAAERLGYIVMSSYNTLSDGPAEPNYWQ